MIAELGLVLLFFSDKSLWDTYRQSVKRSALSQEVKLIFDDLEEYYTKGLDQDGTVDLDQFSTWFHQIQHPEFSETKHQLYNLLFVKLSNQQIEPTDTFTQTLLSHLKSQAAKSAIQKHLDDGSAWNPEIIDSIVSEFKNVDSVTDKRLQFKSCDPKSIFALIERKEGLAWPINSLNQSIGRLIKGDFGLVAAYVDTGKTAFMTTIAAGMGKQILDGDVLYFNNEGSDEQVQARIWSAALRKTKDEIDADLEAASEEYTRVMNGNIERIKIFDCAGWTASDIRFVAKHYNPKLIIIDMLDKLQPETKGEHLEHTRLSQLYIAIRSVAKEFCPVIGTSQCDQSVTYVDRETHEEKFVQYIPMRSLNESKVGKQAEMEFIITIGKDKSYPMTRYLNVPKNKLPGVGNPAFRYMKSEVSFNEQYSLYED